MIIENPVLQDVPALRALWKQAFSDTDSFLDSFFSLAFSPERAMVARQEGKIVGALYWFDCTWDAKALAYIYAVATDISCRGQGICTALMEEVHNQMAQAGKGTVLVPAEKELRAFYGKRGYRDFGGMDEVACFAGEDGMPAEKLTAAAYAAKRRQLLPKGSVLQEGAFLPFLADNMDFYGGEDWLLAISDDFAPEFLGEKALLPKILKGLQIPVARVRYAGNTPFAMYRGSKEDSSSPEYFAFALD